jgi:hypothetical protein
MPDWPVYSPAPPARNWPPGVQPGAAGFAPTKKMEDESDHNFCVRTLFLANLGFLKS